jgi:hypothetical protein
MPAYELIPKLRHLPYSNSQAFNNPIPQEPSYLSIFKTARTLPITNILAGAKQAYGLS